eukprot:3096150-Amphidinium_carterae.2
MAAGADEQCMWDWWLEITPGVHNMISQSQKPEPQDSGSCSAASNGESQENRGSPNVTTRCSRITGHCRSLRTCGPGCGWTTVSCWLFWSPSQRRKPRWSTGVRDHRSPSTLIGEVLRWDAGGTDSVGEPHCPMAPNFVRTLLSWVWPGSRSWMASYRTQQLNTGYRIQSWSSHSG